MPTIVVFTVQIHCAQITNETTYAKRIVASQKIRATLVSGAVQKRANLKKQTCAV